MTVSDSIALTDHRVGRSAHVVRTKASPEGENTLIAQDFDGGVQHALVLRTVLCER